MQEVVVAGGAGFIGSHLCEELLRDGYRVVCIDNLITSDKRNIRHLLNNSSFEFVEHDIAHPDFSLTQRNFQYIFHLASPASPNKKSKRSYISYPIETLLANSVGTYHLLELAKKNNAKFLYASSSEVYGDPTISPQSESYFGYVNPVGVRSVYDEAKRFGEAITMAYFRKHNIDCRIVRIFNTYGPKMQPDDGRVVSNFIMQSIHNNQITIYGNGTQTRSFCFIEDMISGLRKAMFIKETEGQVFNIGNPDEKTILELAIIIKNMTKSSSEIIFEDLPEDDPKTRKPDISKVKQLLDWSPLVSLGEGLRKTIDYFKTL